MTTSTDKRSAVRLARRATTCLTLFMAPALVLAAGALDKARESGKLTFGYRADTRPFSYADGGRAAGYSVALCQSVAEAVKSDLKLPSLTVDFVPVTAADRFNALSQGRIDLLCGTTTPTMERRAAYDFSIPIFYARLVALVRNDAPRRLKDALADRPEVSQPIWRAAPAAVTSKVVLAVVGGTTVENSLLDALASRRVEVSVMRVPDYTTGLQMLLDRRVAALFGDEPVLAEAARRAPAAGELTLIPRTLGREPLALAMRRGDDAFRLAVDRALSRFYRSIGFATFYGRHFGGVPEPGTLEFFQAIALPE